MKTKWLVLAVATPLLLVGANYLAWRWLSDRLRDEYAAWTRNAWSHGWVATADRMEVGGYPFSATLTLGGFALRGGVAALPAGLGWKVEEVTLALSLAHPTMLLVQPEGREELRVSGIDAITFTADQIEASVPLGRVPPGQSERLDLTASDLTGGLVKSTHPRDVRIASLTLHLRAARDATRGSKAALDLHAEAVELPDTGHWPLGATVSRLTAGLDLTSPPLPAGRAAAAAAAWRDGGGRVLLRSLNLKWGPLRLLGQFRLGLDAQLQPAGEGIAEVEGYDPTLDALAAAGVIQPGLAATAKAVLTLMARPAADGHGIELPMALQHSTVSVAKIPLVQLRAMDWGRV